MSIPKWLIPVSLACAFGLLSACTPEREEQAKEAMEEIEDKAEDIAEETAEKTKEVAGELADKSREIISATGERITDGWITTKVNAKFADEQILNGSNITVETNDYVVTLKGTVESDSAKRRAVEIARGTEGVVRVVDQLVAKVK